MSHRSWAAVATGPTFLLLYIAFANFVLHMLVAGNYGYFRDELYYVVSGTYHLQLGYVDFPPMIAYIAAFLNATVGVGLVTIHVVPALAGAALVFVAGMIARELGGGKWAQVLAAVGALVTAQLAFASIFSMDVLDALWWSLGSYLLIRILRRRTPRLWILFGLVAGLGLLTKLTIAFFLLSLIVGILATPARGQLRTKWFWLGALVAVAFVVPYLAWNAVNGWPTFDFYVHHGGLNGSGPANFVLLQILIANPVNVPVVFCGLYFYLRSPRGREFRTIGIALSFLFLVFLLTNAKPYFYEAAYPILVAAGAIVIAQRTQRLRRLLPSVALVGLLCAGAIVVPLEMPVLPPGEFVQTYSSLTGAANGAAAQGSAGQFPQYLGDRFGWDNLTSTVLGVVASLPSNERAEACIFASNYGEASALTLLGSKDGLPHVISGHNNFYLWGPGHCGPVLITVGVSLSELQKGYANVTEAGLVRCDYCMTYENDLPVYVATGPIVGLQSAWPSLKDFS